MEFSTNRKINTVCVDINYQLLEMCETKEESVSEIKRYFKEFPRETDFNIVQYGNLLCYYSQVREMFKRCGYKVENYTDEQLWNYYKYLTGRVVRKLLRDYL